MHEVVHFESASRNSEPFQQLIDAKAMLPNVAHRFCTYVLKVETAERWLRRDLGIDPKKVTTILGIRYDEPKRWQRALYEECKTIYPMVYDRVTVADITAFWNAQPFDLAIPSAAGNCDLCFLKGRGKLIRLIRGNPSAAEWWIDAERRVGSLPNRSRSTKATFSKRGSYAALVDLANKPDLQLAMPGLDLEPTVSCFCGE